MTFQFFLYKITEHVYTVNYRDAFLQAEVFVLAEHVN